MCTFLQNCQTAVIYSEINCEPEDLAATENHLNFLQNSKDFTLNKSVRRVAGKKRY